jgi:adenylate cyclase
METGDVKRKLTAILSADVKGYSRLMEEDELATVETLTSHKEIMGKLIRQYRGRVVDSTGDNLLAEFASVVDAVQCAVEIQQVLSSKNETLPENRRMNFRIGINSGDVIEEGELIYGDGVNVAARIEGLAEGGGISISGTAFDQLGKKLPLGYEYLGEQSVKNIRKPVRVYRVLTEEEAVGKVIGEARAKTKQLRGVAIGAVAVLVIVAAALAIWNFYFRPAFEPASVERMAFPLPDKPSIAVLPFVNMSEDPKQEYFSDGLTDQIISGLSKVPHLFVIARNSTFAYKGKPVKVQQVAEDLGVRYVLEGSVQKSADRIRITAQLIDATKGHHLWSERYERDLKDIFIIQDDITLEIMKAMQIELSEGEQVRQWLKHATDNLEAYEKALQARSYALRGTKEGNVRARQLYEEVIALDPGYAGAYAGLGWTHFFDARFGLSDSRPKSIEMAFKHAQKAIELDETLDWGHILLSAIYVVSRQYQKAIAEAERAVALNPNGADAYVTLAGVLGCSGRWEEGIALSKKAIRLNPHPTVYNFHYLGRAYFMTGQYDEAILTFKKTLGISPNYLPGHAFLAASYSSSGRETEAAAEADEILRINPKFCLESYAKTLPYKNKSDIERYMAALRKAGLPETPPLPLPDKPSIAVLPFVNMSGDPEQEYFSDGITESIITGLSKTPRLFVIARNSSFTYKGKPTKVQKVGRELGVRYVLEGSVQKSKDRVRITVQLVDAKTGNHVWAQQYDRDLKDIFALQDEITMKVIRALQVKLTEGEQARMMGKGTNNLEAYLKAIQAQEQFYLMNRQGSVKAKEFAKEAIALDPQYAFPYTTLANAHMLDAWFKFSKSPRESLRLAADAAQKAFALDDADPTVYSTFTNLYVMQRRYDEAIASAERDLEISPGGARAHISMAIALRWAGRYEEAVTFAEQAIRLNPYPPSTYFRLVGSAYAAVGRYDEALVAYKKALQLNPNDIFTHLSLATVYVSLGRIQDARAEAREVLRIHPKFSVEAFSTRLTYKNQADTERLVDALHKAGLK